MSKCGHQLYELPGGHSQALEVSGKKSKFKPFSVWLQGVVSLLGLHAAHTVDTRNVVASPVEVAHATERGFSVCGGIGNSAHHAAFRFNVERNRLRFDNCVHANALASRRRHLGQNAEQQQHACVSKLK